MLPDWTPKTTQQAAVPGLTPQDSPLNPPLDLTDPKLRAQLTQQGKDWWAQNKPQVVKQLGSKFPKILDNLVGLTLELAQTLVDQNQENPSVALLYAEEEYLMPREPLSPPTNEWDADN